MNWVRAPRTEMRSGIETFDEFLRRNLDWWVENRKAQQVACRTHFKDFIEFGKIRTALDGTQVVAEVGGGPFGGVLEVCELPARRKVFIDYIMQELYDLRFIDWPDNATYVDAPAEAIPLPDDAVDVLLTHNCLDHGWDAFQAVRECIRISKKAFICFDCRGDNREEVDIRRDGHDKDHYQLLKYDDLCRFLRDELQRVQRLEVSDMKRKHFPVAYIIVEK